MYQACNLEGRPQPQCGDSQRARRVEGDRSGLRRWDDDWLRRLPVRMHGSSLVTLFQVDVLIQRLGSRPLEPQLVTPRIERYRCGICVLHRDGSIHDHPDAVHVMYLGAAHLVRCDHDGRLLDEHFREPVATIGSGDGRTDVARASLELRARLPQSLLLHERLRPLRRGEARLRFVRGGSFFDGAGRGAYQGDFGSSCRCHGDEERLRLGHQPSMASPSGRHNGDCIAWCHPRRTRMAGCNPVGRWLWVRPA